MSRRNNNTLTPPQNPHHSTILLANKFDDNVTFYLKLKLYIFSMKREMFFEAARQGQLNLKIPTDIASSSHKNLEPQGS